MVHYEDKSYGYAYDMNLMVMHMICAGDSLKIYC